MSLPTVTVSTTETIPSVLPLYYNPPVISASALTPSTIIPFTTIANTTIPFPSTAFPYGPVYPSAIAYPDINADKLLREQVTNYFFEKIINNWLRYHYLDIYKYVIISDGKAMLVKNEKQIENNVKNDAKENAIKYEFIVDNYLTKQDVAYLLNKFRKINNINWWDIKNHSEKVRKYIKHKVIKLMLHQIKQA